MYLTQTYCNHDSESIQLCARVFAESCFRGKCASSLR